MHEAIFRKSFIFSIFSKAGLASPSNPEQVLIALEPEAASVYCRDRKMRDLVTENQGNDASVADTLDHPKTKYVVIDIGGKYLVNEITNKRSFHIKSPQYLQPLTEHIEQSELFFVDLI